MGIDRDRKPLGLVDNFRDFKSNPNPIRHSLLPVRPVAKQKALVAALGEKVAFDLYLLNDWIRPAPRSPHLFHHRSAACGTSVPTTRPKFVHDELSYLVKGSSPSLDREGVWTTQFALNGNEETEHKRKMLGRQSHAAHISTSPRFTF